MFDDKKIDFSIMNFLTENPTYTYLLDIDSLRTFTIESKSILKGFTLELVLIYEIPICLVS